MNPLLESPPSAAHRRIRNQIGNLLIFGSLIGFAASGLLGGAMAGVAVIDRIFPGDSDAFLKLAGVILTTLLGFAVGVATSFYTSPLVLRFAFFAESAGEWRGIRIYACDESDLPGNVPGVFVAGFHRGIGCFRPTIFASRSSFHLLPRDALEAVFAHEVSHVRLGHLAQRLGTAMLTFITASVLTSAMLLGMEWSGYARIGGGVSLLGGIVPAILTWMSMRNLQWRHEFEADENAVSRLGASPQSLLRALTFLQETIGGEPHPIVVARMAKLRARIESASACERLEASASPTPFSDAA